MVFKAPATERVTLNTTLDFASPYKQPRYLIDYFRLIGFRIYNTAKAYVPGTPNNDPNSRQDYSI
jgi:hypothetical protein